MKTVYTITESLYGINLDDLKIGDNYILVSRENILTGSTTYRLVPDNGGISGNMDPSIKRYHGWRGTTNDISTYAYGLRRIERIDAIKGDAFGNRSVKVKLSADLKPEEE